MLYASLKAYPDYWGKVVDIHKTRSGGQSLTTITITVGEGTTSITLPIGQFDIYTMPYNPAACLLTVQ